MGKIMKIAIASDHAGFEVKRYLVEKLKKEYPVIDFGCFSEESCDYPDHAYKVALAVSKKEVDFGVLICGTGVGMSIVANKIKGVRAALCYSEEVVSLAREHNNSNIICLPSRVKINGEKITSEKLYCWIKVFLKTNFSREDRHKRRVEKIELIEKNNFK